MKIYQFQQLLRSQLSYEPETVKWRQCHRFTKAL